MLQRFAFLILILAGFSTAFLLAEEQEEEKELQVPHQFSVRQRWFSWTNTFDIENSLVKMGTLHRRFLSFTVQYDFYDEQEKLQANARMRFFSIGALFDITDSTGKLIGTTEERIFRFFPTFDIFSSEQVRLAIAKMNFWGTKYTLYDPSTDEKFVVMSRPFIRFRDSWNVTIINPLLFEQKNIDPRLFIVVMAYQTDRDFWRYQARHNKMLMNIESLTCDDLEKAKWDELKTELDCYRYVLEGPEPTEEDFSYMENITEDYLAEIKEIDQEQGSLDQDASTSVYAYILLQEKHIYKGIKYLIPLLNDDHFTAAQKKALFLMLDVQLQQILNPS